MKRLVDIVLALFAIVILSPILIIAALAVRISLGSPVLFTQLRVGKNDKFFSLFKFRSMNNNKDDLGDLLPNIQRITPLGRFLRKSSIDELPSLFNILKGDMSLVGPRPLLPRYLEHYSEFHRQRHQVKPGLTGLAQVNGRNNITWQKRLDLDIDYVQNNSFILDIKILFLTVLKVLKREDVEGGTDLSIISLDKDPTYNKELN
jgi:lipopolysaccharide/colanic/teichoic acid biosynthesis glycosyltransferase